MAFGDYDFSLVAGQSVQLAVKGAFLRVRQATGKVRVSIDGGQGVTLQAGQGFTMPAGRSFRDVTVKDVSGQANAGVIFIGDAGFDDQTLFGSVSINGGQLGVRDEFADYAAQGNAFSATSNPQTVPNAAVMRLYMLNPAGSGKTAYFKRFNIALQAADAFKSAASQIFAYKLTGATANPGVAASNGIGPSPAGGVVQIGNDQSTYLNGWIYTGGAMVSTCVPGGESDATGILLAPGQALILAAANADGVARTITTSAIWYEK